MEEEEEEEEEEAGRLGRRRWRGGVEKDAVRAAKKSVEWLLMKMTSPF